MGLRPLASSAPSALQNTYCMWLDCNALGPKPPLASRTDAAAQLSNCCCSCTTHHFSC